MGRKVGPCTRSRPCHAFSLLEVVVGMVVVGLILVPTTVFMSDVLRGETTLRDRSELLQLARGKQSEFGHMTRVRFENQTAAGTFSAVGYPLHRYTVNCSQATSEGGIPGRLMSIRTLAWVDVNLNGRLDPTEGSVDLWTTVARASP
ncbi:MAG: prepilin-type N-terminal cleavage/methylation domain-containing protein [Pirellulaceae bacterium]